MSKFADKPKAAPAIDATNAYEVANYVADLLEKEEQTGFDESDQGRSKEILSEEDLFEESDDAELDEAIEEGEDEEEDDNSVPNEEEESDLSDEDEPTYLAKIDGEDVEVGLSELLQGYSRQADYTKKTTALAEEKKKFDRERGILKEMAKLSIDHLVHLDPFLKNHLGTDWDDMRRNDPGQYARLKPIFDQQVRHLHQIQKAFDEQLAEIRQSNMEAEQGRLAEKFPEYQDDEKLEEFRQEILPLLEEFDFSAEEVDEMGDHRFFLLVKDALEGRKLRKAMQSMKDKKVSAKPVRVQKPGTGSEGKSQSKAIQELKQKAKQSGRMADLMRLVEALN